jgi:nucleoside-diphosphate-sugar epimerase
VSASSVPLPPGGTVVLAGCGALGSRLGLWLLEAGHRVIAVRRNPSGLPSGFETIAADLASGDPLPALPAADSVVITLPPLGGPGAENGAVMAVRTLARALPARPGRTVLVSSTRVFDGAPTGAVLSEADAPAPATPRATALLETEAAAVGELGAHVLRPSGIYGPGRDFLVRTVRAGRPVNRSRLTNRIHEDDLVRALEALLRVPAAHAVLHATDAGPAPLGEVADFLAERLGLPALADTGEGPEGRVFDGGALASLLGTLSFQDFQAGYAAMVEAKA